MVHEQIDKLSSASIKTAHLRHKGLLLGVVRALLKKEAWGWALWSWNDCQLQSKPTEFHLTFLHTTSVLLLYFFFYFFWMPIVKLLLKRATIVRKLSVQSGQLSRSLAFSAWLAGSPFSRCRRGPSERSGGGAQTCWRKRVGEGRLWRGGSAQPQLLCLRHEIPLALCSLPAENESGNRVNCT